MKPRQQYVTSETLLLDLQCRAYGAVQKKQFALRVASCLELEIGLLLQNTFSRSHLAIDGNMTTPKAQPSLPDLTNLDARIAIAITGLVVC